MSDFFSGARLLASGFGWWRRRPGLMLLGLIPAAIVSVALGAALLSLAAGLVPLTATLTPFAESWPGFWAVLMRVAVGTAVFGGALLLAAATFTALTLLVGEPFYDRIWRSVEAAEGGGVPARDPGWRAAVADALSLIWRGVLAAVLAFAIGLVPVIGGVLGAVAGVLLSGWILADELSARALTARGVDRRTRRRLLKGSRARTLGFGVATQLCFLAPLGAVLIMPVAVVGATRLAHRALASDAAGLPDSSS